MHQTPDPDSSISSGLSRLDDPDYYGNSEFTDNHLFLTQRNDPPISSFSMLAYLVHNVLQGPVSIMLDHSIIILVALLTRFVHLLIDLMRLPQAVKLKDLCTCILAMYLIEQYLKKVVGPNNASDMQSLRTFLYAALFSLSLFMRLSEGTVSRHKPKLPVAPVTVLGSCLVIVAPIIVNEYLIHRHGKNFNCVLRGILMTLVMKVSSQVFSPKSISPTRKPNLLSSLAYVMHPATCITGLWYLRLEPHSNSTSAAWKLKCFYGQIRNFTVVLLSAFVSLLVATNSIDLVELIFSTGYLSQRLEPALNTYTTALEFRFSHYFSCYLTLSLVGLWEDPAKHSKLKICDVLKVELPRSLLQVVTNWNIPMHWWLKDHVFKPLNRHYKIPALSIFLTYFVSSSIHGLKFHIWAVLLTLGLLTWIEYRLRKNTSERLDGCVLASPCQYTIDDNKCTRGHLKTPFNSLIVRLINLFFGLLAMAHLAYLGYIFVGNTDEATFMVPLQMWSEVYFYGHVMALLTYLMALII